MANKLSPEEIAQLQADLEAAKASFIEKDQQLKDALQANEALQEKLEELEMQVEAMAKAGVPAAAPVAVKKPVIPTDTFKVGDDSFVFTIPKFAIDNTVYLSSEALSQPDLLGKLVEMGFGGIKRAGE